MVELVAKEGILLHHQLAPRVESRRGKEGIQLHVWHEVPTHAPVCPSLGRWVGMGVW